MSGPCSSCGYDPGFEAVVCPRCGERGDNRQPANSDDGVTWFDMTAAIRPGDAKASAALFVRKGPDVGRQFVLRPSNTLGRERTCEVALKDSRVSREHARIKLVRGQFIYQDLQASNGSFLVANGREERLRKPHVLCDGDEILVGGSVLRFILYDQGAQR